MDGTGSLGPEEFKTLWLKIRKYLVINSFLSLGREGHLPGPHHLPPLLTLYNTHPWTVLDPGLSRLWSKPSKPGHTVQKGA